MICPKCGEVNSSTFRFCGMCGTLLDTRRSAATPVSVAENAPRIANVPDPLSPAPTENSSRAVNKSAPTISGPSMLGLDQPFSDEGTRIQSERPSMDSLRETAFSGLESFREPEQSRGKGRMLLLIALLAALGVAGWWTYTNYLGVAGMRKPEPAPSNSGVNPTEQPPSPNAAQAGPALDAGSPPPSTPTPVVPQSQTGNASSTPQVSDKTTDASRQPSPEAKPAAPTTVVHAEKVAKKPAPSMTPTKPSISATPAADTGDAEFRKGEAYLYGRGGAENCDEAVKNLKAASAKSNAKARSAFGTMYATGHCVPRDLPTSYLWFALALRIDPNNQILEKDLSAIWNQMTPPERQMATRMKQ